ncbi:MAG: sigma-70 family RNA polymerase sigma factor [Oscillospiraceae bacterium]|nr:sigma-70 family RNA polymerase sigma factor [Oscillospiraceae bacterium]
MISSALAGLETEERRNELAEFYEQNKSGLYAFAMSRTRNREKAEDAVQEAFLRIAKYPETFFALPVHKRMSYAVIVTGNAVNDIFSESAKSSELPDTIEDNSLSVEDTALGNISAEELKAFIKAMPEAQRQAVILKIVCEMTTAEIACALNISEPTARKRVSNAYKTIKKYLNGG